MRKKIQILIILLTISFGLSLISSSPVLAEKEDNECEWVIATISNTASLMNVKTIKELTCTSKNLKLQDKDKCDPSNKPDLGEFPYGHTKTAICCCKYVEPAKPPPLPVIPFKPQIDLGINFEAPSAITIEGGKVSYEVNWLGQYLSKVYDIAVKFGSIIATIMLMVGGILWLISAGNASKTSQAKTIINNSLIGLVLLFSSYLILYTINPDLVNPPAISIGGVNISIETEVMANKNSSLANTYKNMQCATNAQLEEGVEFYATGYCKPSYRDTLEFFCQVAMNCWCPNGGARDKSQNCNQWYGKNHPNYAPCAHFKEDVEYCTKTKSNTTPTINRTIAGPKNCGHTDLKEGAIVCFNGQTYKFEDIGDAIQGRRIDIWTGTDCKKAHQVTGVGVLTLGPCPGDVPPMINP